MSLQSKVIRICFPVWLAGVRGREVWGVGWGMEWGCFCVVTCLQGSPTPQKWGLHIASYLPDKMV